MSHEPVNWISNVIPTELCRLYLYKHSPVQRFFSFALFAFQNVLCVFIYVLVKWTVQYTQFGLVHCSSVPSWVQICGLYWWRKRGYTETQERFTLSDMAAIAIPHSNTGDYTQDSSLVGTEVNTLALHCCGPGLVTGINTWDGM